MTVNVAIFGAGGRMGEALLRFHDALEDVRVVAGVLRAQDPLVGEDASRVFGGPELGIPLLGQLDGLFDPGFQGNKKVDVMIDFSRPELTLELGRWCQQHGIAMVTGTTGFTPEQYNQLQDIAKVIPVVHSNNMSPGVNLCFEIVADIAKRLGDQVDVEIVEAHHKHKIDAPSGTALRLGEAVANAWGVDLKSRAVFTREGRTGARIDGSIGFATIRAADIVGDHRVIFASEGESIEIVHRSTSRVHYAKGALMAAQWLSQQSPQLYSMAQVLASDVK